MENSWKNGLALALGADNDNGGGAETDEVEMPSCPPSQVESMDGDSMDALGAVGGTGTSSEVYKTEEGGFESDKSTRSCIIKMLDEMDGRVEKLRADTSKVEAERDDILTTLDTLSNSQLVHDLDGVDLDEVNRYIKRLAQRSAAVKVEISTERSQPQQESLHAVNTLIDALIREVKSNAEAARRHCISYLNSCLDESDEQFQRDCGIDAKFEAAVLGCTLEDQKRVKKRLNGLYSYFLTYSESDYTPTALTKIKEESEHP